MMILTFTLGAAIGGAVVWWFASRMAARQLAAARVGMRREIQHWQDAAARARAEAQRREREVQSWSDGCKQGREDVISIVPLLMDAQKREPAGLSAGNAEGGGQGTLNGWRRMAAARRGAGAGPAGG